MTLATLVERCGHEVVQVVGSGLDAIQAYSKLRPEVVLMDYSMPRLNGATACRMILAKDPAARIIIVSGVATNETLADSGAMAILPKPVNLEQLYAALYDAASQAPVPKVEELKPPSPGPDTPCS